MRASGNLYSLFFIFWLFFLFARFPQTPFPKLKSGDAKVWEAVLEDGFRVLFGSALWPVTTATMRALEVRWAICTYNATLTV